VPGPSGLGRRAVHTAVHAHVNGAAMPTDEGNQHGLLFFFFVFFFFFKGARSFCCCCLEPTPLRGAGKRGIRLLNGTYGGGDNKGQ